MTLNEAKQIFTNTLLAVYPAGEVSGMFRLVAAHLTGWSTAQQHLNMQISLPGHTAQQFADIAQSLQQQQPLQYILGETEFYDLQFSVSPAVLIPRPETEELVDMIVKQQTSSPKKNKILDIGTGSGCIAISLAHALPQSQVSAFDVSADALAVARANALRNRVLVDFLQVDILDRRQWPVGNFDLIVSNPPYVRDSEKPMMHANVLDHEPHIALFVSDSNPLIFYTTIADFALLHLTPGGQLFFEINEYLGYEMHEMLTAKGFTNVSLIKDLNGKNRMTCATRVA